MDAHWRKEFAHKAKTTNHHRSRAFRFLDEATASVDTITEKDSTRPTTSQSNVLVITDTVACRG